MIGLQTEQFVSSRQAMKDQLNHGLLLPEEMNAYLRLAKQGDRQAVDILIKHNQKLVREVALKYFNAGMCGDQELEDVCQWGNMGLLQAIVKWDESQGSKFSTYAYWWIRSFVRRWGIMKGSGLTITFRSSDMVTAIRKARAQLQEELHREPTTQEIAVRAGVTDREVKAVIAIMEDMHSLDAQYQKSRATKTVVRNDHSGDKEELSLRDLLPDRNQEGIEDTAIENVLVDKIMREIEGLPANLRTILLHRYGLDGHPVLTYEKLGRRFNVSPTTIQNNEKEAIRHLRGRLMVSV